MNYVAVPWPGAINVLVQLFFSACLTSSLAGAPRANNHLSLLIATMEDRWDFNTELLMGPLSEILELIYHPENKYGDDWFRWHEFWIALADSRGLGSTPYTDEQVG
jgi:hypothetical protein